MRSQSGSVTIMDDDQTSKRAVGLRIRRRRRWLDLTQTQALESCGLHPAGLSRLENGHAYPTVPTLLHLCDALGVTPDYILMGETGDGGDHD